MRAPVRSSAMKQGVETAEFDGNGEPDSPNEDVVAAELEPLAPLVLGRSRLAQLAAGIFVVAEELRS